VGFESFGLVLLDVGLRGVGVIGLGQIGAWLLGVRLLGTWLVGPWLVGVRLGQNRPALALPGLGVDVADRALDSGEFTGRVHTAGAAGTGRGPDHRTAAGGGAFGRRLGQG